MQIVYISKMKTWHRSHATCWGHVGTSKWNFLKHCNFPLSAVDQPAPLPLVLHVHHSRVFISQGTLRDPRLEPQHPGTPLAMTISPNSQQKSCSTRILPNWMVKPVFIWNQVLFITVFIFVIQTTLYKVTAVTLCMCVCVFAAKTAERSCPENLISGLQSVSSNKGFLQGGGTVYLSLYLSLLMPLPVLAGSLVVLKRQPQCKISFKTVVFPLSKQRDATNAVDLCWTWNGFNQWVLVDFQEGG